LEAVIDNEICSLRTGIFNLGFFGVVNDKQGHQFAEWWADRLYHFCQVAYERHLFTDQKWINLAPIFFDRVRILRNPRFNVATWNLTTRRLAGSFDRGFTVDDEPLGFYHFSGFDSGDIKIMANKYAGDNPAVLSLIRWYEENTDRSGALPAEAPAWSYACFSNGLIITEAHRAIYRLRTDLQESFPDPFHVTPDHVCYYQWFEWRAAIEHPDLIERSEGAPNFIDTAVQGLRPRSRGIDWNRIRLLLLLGWRDRGHARRLAEKAWRIFRLEGFAGITRRLARRF